MGRAHRTSFRLRTASRWRATFAAGALLLARQASAFSGDPSTSVRYTGKEERLTVVADLDDDDANGVADGSQSFVSPNARADLVPLDARYTGASLSVAEGEGQVRVVASGKEIPWAEKLPLGAHLQGLTPGRVHLVAKSGDRRWPVVVDVYGIAFRDGKNRTLDLAREHASLERTPPTRIDTLHPEAPYDDVDALRVVVSSPKEAPASSIAVRSTSADGQPLDVLRDVSVAPIACEPGLVCTASAPLRFVVDDVDRLHPLTRGRSLLAEVGGAVSVAFADGRKLQAIRVQGPRESAIGPIDRTRLTLRPIILRVSPGSGPAIGGTDAGAIAALRQELATASATWGQCGITFGSTAGPALGPMSDRDVVVANPPPPYLVAFGNDAGLAASGGDVHLRVSGTPLSFKTQKGWSTHQAALELVRVAKAKGLPATLSTNARIASGAAASVDVLMKNQRGQLASVELLSSSDATLGVAVGAVDLEDGLQHFRDTDAVAGTIEERTLIKAFEDGDPSTIEVFVIPYFSGGGRIGESFIGSDGSSLRNVVILDRAGIRARRTSLTLAHELGHVILDEPGHPDDFGFDTPTLLMDSDASDASPFGPRRLTVDECVRALRQSGPSANVPLLTPWKLAPLSSERHR